MKGFSLIEVLLVTLLIVLLAFLVGQLPNSLKLVTQSQNSSLAKDIASQKIEDIRAQGYDNLINGTSSLFDSRLASLPSASITETVTDCSASVCKNSEQLKQVSVQINWIEGKNNKSIQLTTLVSSGGLK